MVIFQFSIKFVVVVVAVKRLTKVRIVLNFSTPSTIFNRKNFKSQFSTKGVKCEKLSFRKS